MSHAQATDRVFNKTDPIDDCVTFFTTQRQARLTKEEVLSKLHKLKKIAIELNLSNEKELLQQAAQGNTKSLNALESILLRPHTGFFEGAGMYKAFENTLLPQIISHNSNKKTISIWVPGCTEGHEAYSLALLLNAHREELKEWRISINASDTNANTLKQAEKATFDIDDIDDIIFELYGQGLKKNGHEYIIKSTVRELISFQHDNFYDSAPPKEPYDIIIFRNQLQHWHPELQEKIITNFENTLQLHGYLILSDRESLLGLSNAFVPTSNTQGFYKKIL